MKFIEFIDFSSFSRSKMSKICLNLLNFKKHRIKEINGISVVNKKMLGKTVRFLKMGWKEQLSKVKVMEKKYM